MSSEAYAYAQVVAYSGQVNTPPGSYDTIKEWIREGFVTPESNVLEIGCTTGFNSIQLARYVGAHVTGIDISQESIAVADVNINSGISRLCKFFVADAGKIPFNTTKFSHVIIGGHLPFIEHSLRESHVNEAIRVLAPHGFLLTALYFYHKKPPQRLIDKLKQNFGLELSREYDFSYWAKFFERSDLDCEYLKKYTFDLPDEARSTQYLEAISPAKRGLWKERIKLLVENGKYMNYFVAVHRKADLIDNLRQIPRGGIYTNFRPI